MLPLTRGSVEVHGLLADKLLHYGAQEGERAVLSGPAVRLQPWAEQVIALAVHELVVTSVEHGALGTSVGRVEVTWSVAVDTLLAILIGLCAGANSFRARSPLSPAAARATSPSMPVV